MTDSGPLLRVNDLCKEYDGRLVLRHVNLVIRKTECLVLTGDNGAGKTTLLRCLAGATRPTAGQVSWSDRPARSDAASLRQIGFVAHESRLYPHLTLRENLIFAARMTDLPQPKRCADELLDETGLASFAASVPASLSSGMRRRAAIARALIHQPRIILLDEPSAGLDRDGLQWLLSCIGDLRGRGGCCCIATHDSELCRRLGGRSGHLSCGRFEEPDCGMDPLVAA